MNAIITPTYIGHFQYIKPLLESYFKYVTDKVDNQIYFIIEERDSTLFKTLFSEYLETTYVHLLNFEDLLHQFKVYESTSDLLKKYGRFTYQSLKKMYAMCFVDADNYFILDSESEWIRKTSMSKLIQEFLQKPFVMGSEFSKRKQNKLVDDMEENVSVILGVKAKYWYLENFIWVIEKRVYKDLLEAYGAPIEMAETVNEYDKSSSQIEHKGIMEAILFLNYIANNREKYGYKFVDVYEELNKYLSDEQIDNYLKAQANLFEGGGGILEHVTNLLTNNNVHSLAKMFKKNKINVMRCEYSSVRLFSKQKKFMRIVKPYILAVSQGHWFGDNRKYKYKELKSIGGLL